MPNSNRFDILSISIFWKISLSISFKSVDISAIDISYRYIEQGNRWLLRKTFNANQPWLLKIEVKHYEEKMKEKSKDDTNKKGRLRRAVAVMEFGRRTLFDFERVYSSPPDPRSGGNKHQSLNGNYLDRRNFVINMSGRLFILAVFCLFASQSSLPCFLYFCAIIGHLWFFHCPLL